MPVALGSSISASGEMLVRCNNTYRLVVDDVEWSPVSSSDDGDTYVLSTSGNIVIYVEGERVFFFRNTINADFVINQSLGTRLIDGHVSYVASQPRYMQTSFATGMTSLGVFIYVDDLSAVAALPITSNQENANIALTQTAERLVYNVTGFDLDTYLAIKVGNVLVAFVTPR